MKILVVGGGPGGLFLSILVKRRDPSHQVHIVEQNPAGATYGWGLVFSDGAIDALRPDGPDVIDELTAGKDWPDHMDVIVDGRTVGLDGFHFHRVGRVDLLALLQRHAVAAGVTMEHERRLDGALPVNDYDLVVGADGVNSAVRDHLAGTFEPTVRLGSNWWAWYGTAQPFPAVSLLFENRTEGLYIGHAYGYAADRSGFVVEVTPEIFARVGFADMDEEASRRHCSKVFATHLHGHELLGNRSSWFQPKFVTCRNWSAGNVVLLGDALHTVHPSIGSGTRFAMRDAVALTQAIDESGGGPAEAIRRYEAIRRPAADGFQRAAMRSIAWYEGLAQREISDPEMFAIEYAMRTGRVRWEEFRRRNPKLTESFEHPAAASCC
jgi:2-polyprenyl-6-methoxyphenol hydroxylase-like FAD-dependent oxidoreductase